MGNYQSANLCYFRGRVGTAVSTIHHVLLLHVYPDLTFLHFNKQHSAFLERLSEMRHRYWEQVRYEIEQLNLKQWVSIKME